MRQNGISIMLVSMFAAALSTASHLAAQPAPDADRNSSSDLVVTNATLIDGTGAPPRPAATILVRDGKIAAITDDSSAVDYSHAEVIDASGKYVIPGLSDMHVHLSLGSPLPRDEVTTQKVLAREVYYGVTSILAIGASGASTESIQHLRARRESGDLQAPYIYGTGGHLTLHGTHPIYTLFPPPIREKANQLAEQTPMSEPVDLYPLGIGVSFVRNQEAARKAIAERARGGMNAIKITVESGPTVFGDDHPQMSVEMISAIVDAASAYDLGVHAHVTSLDELEAVLAGGAAGTVHAVWDYPLPDSGHAARMAEADFVIMPTISVYRGAVSLHYVDEPVDLDDPFLRESLSDEEAAALRNPDFIQRFRSRSREMVAKEGDPGIAIRRHMDDFLANLKMLHDSGVPFVLGTDTGTPFTFPGYSVHNELELLVRAGLTPEEALATATRMAPRIVNADDFGTIEPGKRADMLILEKNPLEDIRHTRTIRDVILEGRLIDRGALLTDGE